jgi:hypothetical protein
VSEAGNQRGIVFALATYLVLFGLKLTAYLFTGVMGLLAESHLCVPVGGPVVVTTQSR